MTIESTKQQNLSKNWQELLADTSASHLEQVLSEIQKSTNITLDDLKAIDAIYISKIGYELSDITLSAYIKYLQNNPTADLDIAKQAASRLHSEVVSNDSAKVGLSQELYTILDDIQKRDNHHYYNLLNKDSWQEIQVGIEKKLQTRLTVPKEAQQDIQNRVVHTFGKDQQHIEPTKASYNQPMVPEPQNASPVKYSNKGAIAQYLNSKSVEELAQDIDRNLKMHNTNYINLREGINSHANAPKIVFPAEIQNKMSAIYKELIKRSNDRASSWGNVKQKMEDGVAAIVSVFKTLAGKKVDDTGLKEACMEYKQLEARVRKNKGKSPEVLPAIKKSHTEQLEEERAQQSRPSKRR